MSRSIITLTTDFGTDSPYVAQMKGVILSINSAAIVVDVTHAIGPQDIRQGAIVLEDVAPRFPTGSIHICVVDPGVGTERRIVCAEIDGRYYIAPDNGLLSRMAAGDPAARQVAITNPAYHMANVSPTFHGRDIMAPAAAHLSLGTSLDELGQTIDELVSFSWPEVTFDGRQIRGSILAVDCFGNLITDIDVCHAAQLGSLDSVLVLCSGQTISGVVRTYGQRPAGSLIALFGSSGKLEIALVNGSAAVQLSAEIGDVVKIVLNRD
jgi:S-adenosylmethionine hydrolase